MLLAEPRRGKSVLLQNPADSGIFRTDDGVITGEPGGHFTDNAEAHRVVIAAGDECSARR